MSVALPKRAGDFAAARPVAAPAGGIVCRLSVPMSWRPLNGQPTEDFLESLERPNQRVLARVVDAFDLAATELSEEEEAALAPLHHKLNLLIEMIGRTCYGNPADLPTSIRAELGLRELRWTAASGPAAGDWLTASLYIHPIVLEPLVLCGQVGAVEPTGEGADSRTVLRLCAMGNANAELLGRFVFLENRRNVSIERRSSPERKAQSPVRRVAGMRRIEAVR
ncbi:MAG: PilZ domain-containing protein [Stellaceae bacterium]